MKGQVEETRGEEKIREEEKEGERERRWKVSGALPISALRFTCEILSRSDESGRDGGCRLIKCSRKYSHSRIRALLRRRISERVIYATVTREVRMERGEEITLGLAIAASWL